MLKRYAISLGRGAGCGGSLACGGWLGPLPLIRFCWSNRRPAAPLSGESARINFRGRLDSSSKSSMGNARLGEPVAPEGYRGTGEAWRAGAPSSPPACFSLTCVGESTRYTEVGSKLGAEYRWENSVREGSSGNSSLIRVSKLMIWVKSP